VLQPFLRERRLPAPRVAFVSHANLDHYNVLIPLIRDGSIERIYLNDYFGQSTEPGSMEDRFLRSLTDCGVDVVRVRAGDAIRLGPKTIVHVLWPPVELRDDLTVNDTSLVLRVECDGRRALVTGDLDSTGQAALMDRPAEISSDVLLLPHHGGWEATLPPFVDAVDAEWVVVSSSHRRRAPVSSGAAGAEFYERLGIERRVWTTAETGSIHVTLERDGVRVRSHRKR
jgi:competence protein ComEC